MKPSNVGRVRFIFLVVIFCVFVVSYATLRILTGDKLAYSEYPFVELDDYKPNTTRRDRTVSSSVHRNETRRNVTVTNWTDENLKTILFYNSFFHWKGYMFGLGVEPFKSRCHRSDCRTTLNRSEIDKADVVVFFGRLLSTIPEIPKRRNDRQLFLYLNTEPPPKAYGVTQRLSLEINITVSYRRDSFIRWPYAVTLPKTKEDSPYVPLSEDQLANKTRPVAWMVSRCNRVSTVRSEYVRELTKYIQVDIYGACGNYSCPKFEEKACMELLEEKYKFYLAFENSICDDYITEKSFRTLGYNLVPVVMGRGNYTRDLPPHSFIDTKEFSSPRHLAQYLHYLSRTPTKYLEYFQWKKDFKIRRQDRNGDYVFCKLCEILHDPATRYLSNFDVADWWEDNHCVWSWEKQTKMMSLYHVYD